jgi:hypothetical protein
VYCSSDIISDFFPDCNLNRNDEKNSENENIKVIIMKHNEIHATIIRLIYKKCTIKRKEHVQIAQNTG